MSRWRKTGVAAVLFVAFIGAVQPSGAHPLADTPTPPGSADEPLPSGAVARIGTRPKREGFGTERAYRRFLRRSKATERDLLYRVKLDLLSDRLRRHVFSGAGSTAGEQLALERLLADFRRKWRARTACARGYLITDCSREVPTLSRQGSREPA